MPPLPSLLLLGALVLQPGPDGATSAPPVALDREPDGPAFRVERMPRVRGQKGLWMGRVPLCRDSVASAKRMTLFMGSPAVLISFRPAMRAAVAREAALYSGRQLPVRLDGRVLAAPFVETPILRGEVQMVVRFPSVARRIAAAAGRRCTGRSEGVVAALGKAVKPKPTEKPVAP